MDEPTENSEYYAILNCGRDASTEEIVRAYRKLAQVFHPDKHLDEEHRKQASESFSKVQEAYEVLSAPEKRQVYDVYGKQGLAAGLEVGEHLRSRDELKMEWEKFKAAAEKEKEENSVVQKGSYQCRVDASRLVHGDWGPGGRPVGGPMGLFKSVTAQNALDAMVGDKNAVSLSGQAMVRPAYRRTPHGLEELTLGGGNVVFGFRRIISQDDSVDVSCQLGLATLLSFTTSRRLDPLSGRDGWLNASWGPGVGLGLQAGCSQSLFQHGATQGSVNVVFGPSAASGVTTAISHRAGRWTIMSKLEVGAVHSISARVSLAISPNYTLRAIARLGTTGIDLELGAAQKLAPQVSGYMGASVGYPAGVLLKLRLTRANQSLECPIIMSTSYDDWKVLIGVYTIPPLLFLATSRFVVRPLLSWAKTSKERSAHAAAFETVRTALSQAAAEQSLIDRVARRKVASEQASPSGLVIMEAVYGILEEYQQSRVQQIRQHQQQGGELGSTTDSAASSSTASNTASATTSASTTASSTAATTSVPAASAASNVEQTASVNTSTQGINAAGAESGAGGTRSGLGAAAAGPGSEAAAASSSSSSRQQGEVQEGSQDRREGSRDSAQQQQQQQQPPSSSNRGGADGAEGSSGRSEEAKSRKHRSRRGQANEPPPRWLRVTCALQYLVAGGRLSLAAGVSKSGLMGFTDPAPHAEDPSTKQLYVAFKHKGRIFEAVIGDMDALELPPGAGAAASAAGVERVPQPAREETTLAEEEMGVRKERQPGLKEVTDPTDVVFLESRLRRWLEHGEH